MCQCDFACSIADVMARNWKLSIQMHYTNLLEAIDTENGLFGALKELQSTTFPERTIKRIWVMVSDFGENYYPWHLLNIIECYL